MYLNGLVFIMCVGLGRTVLDEVNGNALTNEPFEELFEDYDRATNISRGAPELVSTTLIKDESNIKDEDENRAELDLVQGARKAESEYVGDYRINLYKTKFSSFGTSSNSSEEDKRNQIGASQQEADASPPYKSTYSAGSDSSSDAATDSNTLITPTKKSLPWHHVLVNESEELWPQHVSLRLAHHPTAEEFSVSKNDFKPFYVNNLHTAVQDPETGNSYPVDDFVDNNEDRNIFVTENSSPAKPFEVHYLSQIYDSKFPGNVLKISAAQSESSESGFKSYSMVPKKKKNPLPLVDGPVPKSRLHLYSPENNLRTIAASSISRNVLDFKENISNPGAEKKLLNKDEDSKIHNKLHNRGKRSLNSEEDIWQNHFSSISRRQRKRSSHHSRVARQRIKNRKSRKSFSDREGHKKRVSRMSKKQSTSSRNDHNVQLFSRWSRWTRCNRRCKQKRRRRCKKKQLCGSALIKEERSCFGWRCKKRPPQKIEESFSQAETDHSQQRETMDLQSRKSTQKHSDISNNLVSAEGSNKMSSEGNINTHYFNKEQKLVVGPNHSKPHQQSSRYHRRPIALEKNSVEAHGRPPVSHSSPLKPSSEDKNNKSEKRRPFKVVQGRKSSHRDLRLLLNFNAVFYTRWSDWGECSTTCLTSRYRWCKYRLFCGGAIVREEAYCYVPGDACESKYKEENGDVTVQEYLTNSIEEKPGMELPKNDWDRTHYELFSNEREASARNDRINTFINEKDEIFNSKPRDPSSSRWPDASFPWEDHMSSHSRGQTEGRSTTHRGTHDSLTSDDSRNRYNIVSAEHPSGQSHGNLENHESVSLGERNDIFRDRDREPWHRRRENNDLHHDESHHGNGQTNHHRRRYPAHRDSNNDLEDEAGLSNLFGAKVSSSSFAFSPSQESTHSSSTSSVASSGLISMSASSSSGQSTRLPSIALASSGFLPFSSSRRNSSFPVSPRLTHFPSSLLSSLAGFGKSSILDSRSPTSSTSLGQHPSPTTAGDIPTLLEPSSLGSRIQDNNHYNLGRDEGNKGVVPEDHATSVELFNSDEAVNLGSSENRSTDIFFDLVPLGSPRPPPSSLSSHLSSFFLSQTDSVDPSPSSPTPFPSLHSPNLNAVCGVSTKGLWVDGRGHNTTGASEDGRRSYGLKKAGLSLKILGGREAERGQWPWQVVILNRYREAFCGGVVVGPRWVLTAAHCVRKRLYARLAEHDLSVSEGTELEFRVSESISHPLYDSTTVDNDVALLRLPQPLDYTPYLSPVCLPDQGAPLPVGEVCTIIGWGKERHTHLFGTDVLHQAEVPIIASASCRAVYKDYYITPNMFCAGYRGGRVDSCAGDSGGPLLCRQGHKWHVVGITSFGEGCGRRGKYGIYARVSNYRSWIRDVMSAHEQRSRGQQRELRSTESRKSFQARHAGWLRP